jgi:hypothetical protein
MGRGAALSASPCRRSRGAIAQASKVSRRRCEAPVSSSDPVRHTSHQIGVRGELRRRRRVDLVQEAQADGVQSISPRG